MSADRNRNGISFLVTLESRLERKGLFRTLIFFSGFAAGTGTAGINGFSEAGSGAATISLGCALTSNSTSVVTSTRPWL